MTVSDSVSSPSPKGGGSRLGAPLNPPVIVYAVLPRGITVVSWAVNRHTSPCDALASCPWCCSFSWCKAEGRRTARRSTPPYGPWAL